MSETKLPTALLRLRDEGAKSYGKGFYPNSFRAGFTFAATHMMEEMELLLDTIRSAIFELQDDSFENWDAVVADCKASITRHAKWKEGL